MVRLSKTGRFVSTALMLSALAVGSAAAQPHHGPPPRPAYRHGPPPRYYGGHGGGYGAGAFVGGALLGLGAGALIGSALAPPPAVVYSAPPPGYYQAPPPVYYGY
jgi:hypothetical protein